MPTEPIELRPALEKMSLLLHRWGLGIDDWILTGQYVYRILGYNTSVRPGHHNVLVRRNAIPWAVPAAVLEVHPPVNSRFEHDFQSFLNDTGHDFDLVLLSDSDMKWHLNETAYFTLPDQQRIRIHTPRGQLKKIENMLRLSNTEGIGEAKGRRLLKFVAELQAALQDYGQSDLAAAHAEIIQRYAHLQAQHAPTAKTVKGAPACPGKTTGVVKVITDFSRAKALTPDEVLVTSMTSPRYTHLIQTAAAFVTDEGGLLCHAAIIARELHKPCIVGTGNATTILKTGQRIIVDADAGTVKVQKLTDNPQHLGENVTKF